MSESGRFRAFCALPLPAVAAECLRDVQERLKQAWPGRARARWVPPENWHVTLQFLGEVSTDQATRLADGLGRVAEQTPPLASHWSALEGFGSARRARVVVMAAADPTGRIRALSANVHGLTKPLGLGAERREFRPHVTLARLKSPTRIDSVLEGQAVPPRPFRFETITLFRSDLGPAGAKYQPVATAPLTGSD